MNDIVQWLLWIVVLLTAAWCRSQEKKIACLEEFEKSVLRHWEEEARRYMSKTDFNEFAKEIKDALIRIEEKIEKLRR